MLHFSANKYLKTSLTYRGLQALYTLLEDAYFARSKINLKTEASLSTPCALFTQMQTFISQCGKEIEQVMHAQIL